MFVSSGNLKSGHTVSCGTHNHKRIEYKVLKNLDDKENNYLVYRHIAPNGKSYIGITKQDAERRFQDGNGYKSQHQFWRAIKKYGWNSFQHEILENGLSEKEASEKEAYYIKIYNTFVPNGYNVAEGGITGKKAVKPIIQYFNGKPVNLFKSSREATSALGIAMATIKSHSDINMSVGGYYFKQLPLMFINEIPDEYISLKDTNHYNIKDIVADNLKQTTVKRNVSSTRSINQYELSGKYICTYPSIKSAKASIKGCSGEAISAAVNPNRQGDTAYGFMWKYNTGDYSDINPIKYKIQKAVLQIDIETGEVVKEYKSVSEAARTIHTHQDNIAQVCIGKKTNWKGYKWKYKDNDTACK